MKKSLLLLMSFKVAIFYGQVKISDGPISATDINSESILHLESTSNNKGFLQIRLNLTSTDSPAPLSAHKRGMVVYNTASVNNVTPGLYFSNGTEWIRLGVMFPEYRYHNQIGDVKNGFQSADHEGWYLLDGRALSTLSTIAQENAAALGFSGNLSNLEERYLKNIIGGESTNTFAGADSFTILQSNLPSGSFSGTAFSAGAHTHNYQYTGTTNRSLRREPLSNRQIVDANSRTTSSTSSSGNHSHSLSFSLGGGGASVSKEPAYINTNVFIYLGN